MFYLIQIDFNCVLPNITFKFVLLQLNCFKSTTKSQLKIIVTFIIPFNLFRQISSDILQN